MGPTPWSGRGKRYPDVGHAAIDVFVEPGEEGVEVGIDGVDHGALLGGIGADAVAEDVGGGDADGEDVGDVVAAHLLAGDEGAGEVHEVGDGGRGCASFFVEVFGVVEGGFAVRPGRCARPRLNAWAQGGSWVIQ